MLVNFRDSKEVLNPLDLKQFHGRVVPNRRINIPIEHYQS